MMIALVLGTGAREASAQVSQAQSLFQEGRRLSKEGKTSEACKRFAESFRLEHRAVTLLNLAACHRDEGRTASAWVEFQQAQAISEREGKSEGAAEAKKQAAAVEAKLSYVVFDAAWKRPDESLTIDGAAVGRSLWDTPRPLDPGSHVIHVDASDAVPYDITIDVPPGPKTTHVTLREPAVDKSRKVAPPPPPPPASVTAPPPSPGRGRVVLAVVLGASGVAAAGVGAAFGLLAMSKNDDVSNLCPNDVCPDPTTRDNASRSDSAAHTFANVANVAIGVGAALVIAGVVVYLTAPRTQTTARWRGVTW